MVFYLFELTILDVNTIAKKDKLFDIQRSTREDYYESHAELLIKKVPSNVAKRFIISINYEMTIKQ